LLTGSLVNVKMNSTFYSVITLLLRAGLIVAIFAVGWFIYSQLPRTPDTNASVSHNQTTLQIVLRPSNIIPAGALDISIELYPVDIVAVRHEYFTERRAGKRFDDFLSERMKGRKPVTGRLDKQGQTSVAIGHGNWWLHALLSGEEELEWRLPISVAGRKQIVELTSQNVYTRTRSF
jgi:hypothetical protein